MDASINARMTSQTTSGSGQSNEPLNTLVTAEREAGVGYKGSSLTEGVPLMTSELQDKGRTIGLCGLLWSFKKRGISAGGE